MRIARPDHRLRCGMFAAVEGEAAVQLGLDVIHRLEEPVGAKIVDEAKRSALRADRIRGRRSRADTVQLERAHVHAAIPSYLHPRSGRWPRGESSG